MNRKHADIWSPSKGSQQGSLSNLHQSHTLWCTVRKFQKSPSVKKKYLYLFEQLFTQVEATQRWDNVMNFQPRDIVSMSGFFTKVNQTDEEKAENLSLSSPLLINYRLTTDPGQNNSAHCSPRYVGFLHYIRLKRPIKRDTRSRIYRHPCKRK